MNQDELGVVFPATKDGRRSTSALGRGVVADALRAVDPVGALGAEREADWRSGYLVHFRHLVEAGLGSRQGAVTIARDGLESVHRRMRVVHPDGDEADLSELRSAPPVRKLRTAVVEGRAEPESEVSVPYGNDVLRGDGLLRRVDAWVEQGVVEPSCADVIGEVVRHPEWLTLPDHTVVVLGAGAEMGPLPVLLRWGCTVAGVDLPRPALWDRVIRTARGCAGRLLLPIGDDAPDEGGDDVLAQHAGLNLIAEVPEAAEWISPLEGDLVLGNYAYADGATHVRVAVAVDALAQRLRADRRDLSFASLATPTDVFAVPKEAVDHSVAAYATARGKLIRRSLRVVSGGRLLRRTYLPGVDPGINDSMVPQQGPNYALAKRIQRWRATAARADGATVSMNVAPSTRTRSVVKNRVLAAAYAGAHRFGVEVFDPKTSNALMAALLVHDLHTGGGPRHEHPWQDEAYAAAHGGLWRTPYAPRSSFGIAALLGRGAVRA